MPGENHQKKDIRRQMDSFKNFQLKVLHGFLLKQ
jgi:hypothetical protein